MKSGVRALSTAAGHIYRSRYPSIFPHDCPTNVTLPDFILRKVDTFGDRKALIDGFTEETYTFKQVGSGIRSVARSLTSMGLKNGDVVAIMSPNNAQYPMAFHGASLAGCVSTTINPLYTEREVDHQVGTAGAKAIIASPSTLDACARVASQRNIPLIVFGDKAPHGATAFTDMMQAHAHVHTPYPLEGRVIDAAKELCTLPFSSGTTGAPKGTMLSHLNLIANLMQAYPGEGNFFGQDAVQLCPLPLFHIYGLSVGMNLGLHSGATVVLMPRFDLEKFLSLVQSYKVRRAHVVPPIVLALGKHPLVDKYDLSSLKVLLSGAAPLGVEVEAAAAKRLNVIVKQGWGSTELSPIGAIVPDDDKRAGIAGAGAAGLLPPDTLARVCDPESGDVLPYGSVGEIQISGPQVMMGYLHNAEATTSTLTPDGYLRTGDVGRFDDTGYLYIMDRCKELIKFKGFQVPPAELEDLLNGHEKVRDSIVIPVPDDEAGELPRAYVVLKETPTDASARAAITTELQAWLSERVAPHKRLRGGVVLAKEIPKTASGKLLRRVVRDRDAQARAQGIAGGADM